MSSPTVPQDLPSIPPELLNSPNPVHKLSATMLVQGLEMLKGFYQTITSYNETQSKAGDLLKTSENDEVVRYRQAAQQLSAEEGKRKQALDAAIKELRDKYDADLQPLKDELHEKFYQPAMKSLNLDAGITENDLGNALKSAVELTESLKGTAAQVGKQGIDMSNFKLPTLSTTGRGQGDIGFTPKFAAVTIRTTNIASGEVTTESITDPQKMRNTDIIKRLKTKRPMFLKRFLSPWSGDESPWRDAAAGYEHTFTFSILNPVEDKDGNLIEGIKTELVVVKASKTKAKTPTGEIIEVDTIDESDVDDDDDDPITQDDVTF